MHHGDLLVRHLDEHCRGIPGDLLECGVATGDTTIRLAQWGICYGARVLAADHWQGIGQPGPEDGSEAIAGEWQRDIAVFARRVQASGLNNIVILLGDVERTLARCNTISQGSLRGGWYDLDLYGPTEAALMVTLPRYRLGAVIGFHDYGFEHLPGIKRVVDEVMGFHPNWRQIAHQDTSIFFQRVA